MNQSASPTLQSMVWTSPISMRHFSTTHWSCLRTTGRWAGIGRNIRGVIVVVFVSLGKEAISVISMRPASRNERKLYAER